MAAEHSPSPPPPDAAGAGARHEEQEDEDEDEPLLPAWAELQRRLRVEAAASPAASPAANAAADTSPGPSGAALPRPAPSRVLPASPRPAPPSPRGADVEGEGESYDFGSGAGFYADVPQALLERYRRTRDRATVLEALQLVAFPESKRGNVRGGHKGPIYGMCLGMTECYFRGPMPSRATRASPRLAQLLCEFVRRERPGFTFTSIQVNKDYASALHVDKNDAGCSLIIGLGAYSGGQLWVDDGSRLGRCLELNGRWHSLDGNRPHQVLPFRGRRYTLIYFSRMRGGDVGADPASPVAKRLFSLGFSLPPALPQQRDYPSKKERLDVATAKMARFRDRCARRGGPSYVRLRAREPSGRLLHVAVLAGAPLRLLASALARRLRLRAPPSLRVGSLAVLPADTPRGLRLRKGDIVDFDAADIAVPGAKRTSAAISHAAEEAEDEAPAEEKPAEEEARAEAPAKEAAPAAEEARAEAPAEEKLAEEAAPHPKLHRVGEGVGEGGAADGEGVLG